MAAIRKLAGQTLVYGFTTILGRILNYLLVPLHTRIFKPEEYGVVAELYAYVTFLLVVYSYGMETGFFRFSNKSDSPIKVFSTAFFSLVGSTVLFTTLLLFFSGEIATLLDYQDHPEYIVYILLILAFDTIAVIPFARLRYQEAAWRFATIKNLNILINVGLNVFFLLLCPFLLDNGPLFMKGWINWLYSQEIGVGYVFIANLVASIVTLLMLTGEMRAIRLTIDWAIWKSMLKYAAPLLIVGLAGMVNETIDRVLLKHFLPYGPEKNMAQLGMYGACYKLSIFMTLSVQAFRYAAEPFFFSESKKQDPRQTYAKVMTYFVFAGSVIFLGVTLYIDILKYFVGSQYYEGLKVVPVLLLANLFLGIYYNLAIWYKLTEQTYLGAMIAILGALVTLGLNIWWIPIFGYMGSAWATFFSYLMMVLVSYILSRKYYQIPYSIGRILFYLVLAVFLYFLSNHAKTNWLGGWNWLSFLFNTVLITAYGLVFAYLENAKILLTLPSYLKQKISGK